MILVKAIPVYSLHVSLIHLLSINQFLSTIAVNSANELARDS